MKVEFFAENLHASVNDSPLLSSCFRLLDGAVRPLFRRETRTRLRAELLAWLKEAHHYWIALISALLDDAELACERPLAWGGTLPSVNIIRIVIAHDVYHAGEINHIRALLQENDHWS